MKEQTEVEPVFGTLNVGDAKEAVALLDEGFALDREIKSKIERLNEIKAGLSNVCTMNGIQGVKNNGIGFRSTWVKGRRSIKRELLLENGVPPDVIEKSYVTGEGYWQQAFFEVLKP